MRSSDQQELIWLYGQAVKRARETGRRQRIAWRRDPGRLYDCSTDFDGGFCCGEMPYTGFVLWINPPDAA